MPKLERDQAAVYQFGKFVLDARERILLAEGRPVHMSNKVFETLLMLVQHNGRLLTKNEMMQAIWQESFVEESNLAKNISRLRKILNTSDTQLIETLPRQGYRFLADVRELDGDGSLLVNRSLRVKITQTLETDVPSKVVTAPTHPALPPKRAARRMAMIVGGLLIALLVGLVLYFRVREAPPPIASGPTRLTNSPTDEDGPTWGADGHIRFARFITRNMAESYVMNSDGSGLARANTVNPAWKSGNWSPDGSKVLYRKIGETANSSYVSDSNGANEVMLPFVPGSTDWSPDGSLMVFNMTPLGSKNAEIFTYRIADGKLTNISNDPAFDANPSFSPDGKKVVFNSQRDGSPANNIFIMNVDGSDVRRLTAFPNGEAFPVFTPDGTQILFNSIRENERIGIYLMNVDGKSPPMLLSDTAYNAETRQRPFSPDGTKIVFMSDMAGEHFNVYVMSAEAVKPTTVVADPDADLSAPSLSPDGKRLAYEAKFDDKRGELRILDLDTHKKRVLVRSPDHDIHPAWSPAGDTIAFRCKIEGTSDICTIGVDGGEIKNITQSTSRDTWPVWSPSGEIIFASTGDSRDALRLFGVMTDGSGLRSITTSYGYEMTPALSPDGRTLAFAGDRQDGRSKNLDIFVTDLASPNEDRVLAVLPGHDAAPAFSPDGRRIAFVSEADGNPEIYLINTDGTGLVRLTRDTADDTSPYFSHDGKQIIFSSNRSGRFAIYIADLPF